MNFLIPYCGRKSGKLKMCVAKGRGPSDEPFDLNIEGDFTKLEERIIESMTQEQHERARRELGWPMRGTGR